ncbi:MAG: zf-HC2 domain-containing protein, partial [Phycisphaerae bacterium]|nr:zf-HC2 domain-containing protein [Phycisphaerae bacterium]
MDWNDRHNLEEQLSAYLDDELTDAERAEVEAALAQDEQARRTLEELRQTAGLLGSLPRGKAPVDLIESLAAQMERSELLNGAPAPPMSLPSAGGRLLRFLASAAVIVLAVSAGFMTFSYLGQEREPPRASSLGPLADAGDVPKEELRRGRSGEAVRGEETLDARVEFDAVVEPAPAKPDATAGREAMDALQARDGFAVGGEIALRAK